MTSNSLKYPAAKAFYRARLDDLGMGTRELMRLIYPHSNNPTGSASYWLYGHGRPSNELAPLIAQALQLKPGDIATLYDGALAPTSRPQSMVKQVLALPAPEPREAAPTPVLSVTMLSNRRVRLKLDVELDGKEGVALAQTLYGIHGLIRDEIE